MQELLRLKEKTADDIDKKQLEFQIHNYEKGPNDVDLPEMRTIFPRARKLPDPNKLTKFEAWAQTQGMHKKQKRSRMVWDEISKDWVPRWGFGSKKKIEKRADFIRPVKPGENPNQDPWEKEALEKGLTQNKQKMAEMKNKLHKKNIKPGMLKKIGKRDEDAKLRVNKKEAKRKQLSEKKDKLKKSLMIAQNSTASMGKFDKKAHKMEQQKKVKKKIKKEGLGANTKQERGRMTEILNNVTRHM